MFIEYLLSVFIGIFIQIFIKRYDSTIPAPYRIWEYYDANITEKKQNRNYAANRTKKVAWFVSNCYDDNGRLDYALELQKYIQVGRNNLIYIQLVSKIKLKFGLLISVIISL